MQQDAHTAGFRHGLSPWPFPEEGRPAFEAAPMTAAAMAVLDRRSLRIAASPASEALAGPLAQALAAARPGDTLGAIDFAGRALRLRCLDVPAALWALERVDAGRRRTLEAIHSAVLRMLGPAIVHELQNPLNTACLRLDLLQHAALSDDAPPDRAAARRQIDGLREPLHRLADLQSALAERWLQDAQGAADGPQPLQVVLASLAGPLYSHYAHRGGRVEFVVADGEALVAAGAVSALRVAIPALLLMLAPRAQTPEKVTATLHAGIDLHAAEAFVDVPLPADGGGLGEALEWSRDALLAALGFALHARAGVHADAAHLHLRLALER